MKAIVRENPLSEEQANNLIRKEQNEGGRKGVLEVLTRQQRKAKKRRNMKHAKVDGVRLETVSNNHISFPSAHPILP